VASRPAIPKRTDPVKLRLQQRAIAEDLVARERERTEGDIVSTPPKPYSPPAKPAPLRRKRSNPTRSQGIVTGFKKGDNII
jgi:hypothetical protein